MNPDEKPDAVALQRRLDRERSARQQAEAIAEDATQRMYATVTELEKTNRDLQQFAYAVSHDLKQPLRTIVGFLELVAMRHTDRLDAEGQRFVRLAVAGEVRLGDLLDGLMRFSRIETAGLKTGDVAADAALDKALADLDFAIRECGGSVERTSLPVVRADETQLVQIFENLLSNALKFRRDGHPPRIRVSGEIDRGKAIISVQDNGIGIAPRHADKVFEIFARLHGPEEYEGTGLGLAICRKILERQGGRIWLESTEESGTTVHFVLPTPSADA